MIGREHEKKRLLESLRSNKSELISVYGRRRIGKTYLIRSVYKKHTKFEVTGMYGGKRNQQLEIFHDELKRVSSKFLNVGAPTNWHDAFELLKIYINGLRGKSKKVIFIDEFPWLNTHKSSFLSYFGHFWNTYCEKRNDLVVVICGSAASFMVHHVGSNKGSLHSRIEYTIELNPFSLYETKEYLKSKNINWQNKSLLHLYISLGGIPHYLSKIKKGQSVVQNIQRLCFDTNGDLVKEFDEIFESLFSQSHLHIKIVKTLANLNKGIVRKQLINKSKLTNNGDFTKALDEIKVSGFVSEYQAFGKKNKDKLIRLTDEYSKFYLKYIMSNKNQGKDFWKTNAQSQSYISWAGFNFETICLKHIDQIKSALGISGIQSVNSSWYGEGAQIDLVIARNDNWINLCEMKFYNDVFIISNSERKKLENRVSNFRRATKTKDATALTMITTYGVKENDNFHEIVDDNLTMDILFQKV